MQFQTHYSKNATTILKAFTVLSLALTLSACKDKVQDPQPDNENEVITTLIIQLVDSSDANKKYTLKSRDLNPTDQIPAVIEIPELENNKTYFGKVLLLDESKATIDTVSNAVSQEAEDHQFIYTSSLAGFEVSYKSNDLDANGYAVGLYPVLRTKDIAGKEANLQVTLYHLPGIKKASPVDNMKNGSVDVEVIFNNITVK